MEKIAYHNYIANYKVIFKRRDRSMYTERDFKRLMEDVNKIQDERSRRVLRSILLEISQNNTNIQEARRAEARKRQIKAKTDINSKEVIQYITKIMLSVGIPANLKGYRYIREAIKMTLEDVNKLQRITAELYPEIAKKFNTSATRAERAMRHAIEVAWARGNMDIIDEIFGYTIQTGKGRPTNSEFIAIISDKVRLDLNV